MGEGAQAGFDEPLRLLSDCHRRIERFLGMLLRVASERRGTTLDAEHRRALEAALQYFRTAAPRHAQDEEESLFPRLRRVQDERVQGALEQIECLESDHRIASGVHEDVENLAHRWLKRGQLEPRYSMCLLVLLHLLQRLYMQHIDMEDRTVFSLAGQVLHADEIEAIGREMADRRGLNLAVFP